MVILANFRKDQNLAQKPQFEQFSKRKGLNISKEYGVIKPLIVKDIDDPKEQLKLMNWNNEIFPEEILEQYPFFKNMIIN